MFCKKWASLQFFCLFLLLSMSLTAQEKTSSYKRVYIGIEQDPAAYLSKGYILTGWAGMQLCRLRFSHASVNAPGFFLAKGIEKERILANQLSFDFFFKKEFKGFWISPGIANWQTEVTSVDQVAYQSNSIVFLVGGGYNWYFYKNFYLSPWVAAHLRLSHAKNIELGTIEYQPRMLTPELSVKIGYRF